MQILRTRETQPVWDLPPTLHLGQKDRGQYVAIGESDRMTLKFTRPALGSRGPAAVHANRDSMRAITSSPDQACGQRVAKSGGRG